MPKTSSSLSGENHSHCELANTDAERNESPWANFFVRCFDLRFALLLLCFYLVPCQSLSIHAESPVDFVLQPAKQVGGAVTPPPPKTDKESAIVPTLTRGIVKEKLPAVFSQKKPNSVKDLRTIQDHLTGLLPDLRACTVNLRVGGAQGSGVIVSPEGHILTAAHVAQKADLLITVVFQNGRRVSARTLGMNRSADSALVKIVDKGPWDYAPIRDSNVKMGEWVVALGHPGGYVAGRKPVVRLGRILSQRKEIIRTDSVLVGGDSGGPLFDMHGYVVGVHSRIGATTSHNMHVKGSIYLNEWSRMMAMETWGGMRRLIPLKAKAVLGVGADPTSDDCRIGNVAPDFPASKAGLKKGDVIIKFDGKKITSFHDLQLAVLAKKPGDKVKIEYKRDGKVLKTEATLKSRL